MERVIWLWPVLYEQKYSQTATASASCQVKIAVTLGVTKCFSTYHNISCKAICVPGEFSHFNLMTSIKVLGVLCLVTEKQVAFCEQFRAGGLRNVIQCLLPVVNVGGEPRSFFCFLWSTVVYSWLIFSSWE